ncbi:MAG: glutathione S-transferase N-terminal domain-containing protein [Neomegalonema sp.]|nr:glutathione S-transferase N-terminal domain-containing protein [Neomegalonema sp.]
MKLYYSPTSPYSRKVRVLLIEAGIDGVELVSDTAMSPDAQVPRFNPLGKVPALVLGTGEVLFDSPVICEFFDQQDGKAQFLPRSGIERIRVLRDQALGDGVLDAAFSTVVEKRREDAQVSPIWLDRWRRAIDRSVSVMEAQIASGKMRPSGAGMPDLGAISWGCALGYLDFRLPMIDWREQAPQLAAWWAQMQARESFTQTEPPA